MKLKQWIEIETQRYEKSLVQLCWRLKSWKLLAQFERKAAFR